MRNNTNAVRYSGHHGHGGAERPRPFPEEPRSGACPRGPPDLATCSLPEEVSAGEHVGIAAEHVHLEEHALFFRVRRHLRVTCCLMQTHPCPWPVSSCSC